MYSEEGQDIAGKYFYRPAVSEKAKAKYTKQIANVNLFKVDEALGGWAKADKEHIDDAFAGQALHPNVVLTAMAADVIKTYVELNMGVGIVASVA